MLHDPFVAALALIGVVIIAASLLSGAVERSGAPQVAIFLLLGAMLGPAGIGVVEFPLQSESIEVLATLALVLVLFSDAISVDIGEVREQRRLATLILGPGTILPAALIAVGAWLLLDLPPAAAAIIGAALASTDPVLLRTLVRSPALPPPARLALRLESGINDVVLLPVVVLAIVALSPGGATSDDVARRAMGLFVLGPVLGVGVGYVAITLLDRVRSSIGVRRDYESLYALGVAFTAFAAAESVGGSGFLAAFAAGLVIAAMDVELCDCFLDYGEASAEMFLLLTFVAFGASVIWTGLEAADVTTFVFALLALGVRTAVLIPVLRLAGVEPRSRRLIAWLGPRGLSTLLLALLPVFAGVEGAVRLFQITSLVVLLSVLVHGGSIAVFLRRARTDRPSTPAALEEEPEPLSFGRASSEPETAPAPEKITIDELRELWQRGEPVTVLDVRTERSYRDSDAIGRDAIRIPPDDAVRLARERRLDPDATLVLYCT
ncbi:MAG TPA: cation:proton antiporter [Gemmatimonadales bacterium]|nr:cation:proton antiporter [Gemmatimonadales bacterium]